MYRIVIESLQNVKNELGSGIDSRSRMAEPFYLLLDSEAYKAGKALTSSDYMKLSQILYLLESDTDKYYRFKSLIWSLSPRGIIGVPFEILSDDEVSEMIKLLTMVIDLAYWDAA
jgi:hypothetical protein